MDNLRLILIIIGVLIIAVIYLWDRIQSRRMKQREEVRPDLDMHEEPELVISGKSSGDDDFSAELADLNNFMAGSKSDDTEDIEAESIVITREASLRGGQAWGSGTEAEIQDLFAHEEPEQDGKLEADSDSPRDTQPDSAITSDSVISLYIAAPPGQELTGNEIHTALTSLGFSIGSMDIFHHYGIGQMKSEKPLFSLANMYEPGYFDITAIDEMSTRGLSVFMCLPARHNAEVVFAFMLEITRRLAKKLDALVLGPDRKQLTQKTLDDIAVQLKQYGG